MIIVIYQLLLFGIKPIRKRVLHWLEEASDAIDFKPYIINSELYLGVTCVIPFVYVLIMAIVPKFMNDESVVTILNWEYRVSFIVGIYHLFIFFVSILHIDVLYYLNQYQNLNHHGHKFTQMMRMHLL